ncbi:hypothetical protein Ancab_000349 [Ancistrocladus abbreviatus]
MIMKSLTDSAVSTWSYSLPSSSSFLPFTSFQRRINYRFHGPHSTNSTNFLQPLPFPKRHRFIALCSSNSRVTFNKFESNTSGDLETPIAEGIEEGNQWNVEVRNPNLPPCVLSSASKFSLSDQAFFLLAFTACTTSVAFTSFVIAATPTLNAMGRAATALSRLTDATREELPSTMAAIRLSGMEISDLILELSDLSKEVSDGITKSTQAVQAAEAGIRQIGSLARQQTISMIQERANLPIVYLQPVVSGAAKKTSRAVGQATRTFMNIISRGELGSENKEDDAANK